MNPYNYTDLHGVFKNIYDPFRIKYLIINLDNTLEIPINSVITNNFKEAFDNKDTLGKEEKVDSFRGDAKTLSSA